MAVRTPGQIIVALGLYSGLLFPLASCAQSGIEPDKSAVYSDVQLPTYEAELEQLEAHARKISKAGTGSYDVNYYYSTLRQGLIRLSGHGAAQGRDATPIARPQMNDITPQVLSGTDDDPEIRRQLDQALERGKQGMRIVGGSWVGAGQFTETVAIVQQLGESAYCTGVVVAPGKIVTAAHCVCEMDLVSGGGGQAQIQFGNPDANIVNSRTAREVQTARTKIMDPDFCERLKNNAICGGDLSVVEFDGTTPEYVKTAKIATAQDVSELATKASSIAGYGDNRRSGSGIPRANRLINDRRVQQKAFAYMPTLPTQCIAGRHSNCSKDGSAYGCDPQTEIVLIDFKNGKDTCNGDSGGPVFAWNRKIQEPQLLIGVTSRGVLRSGACGQGGIYTSVMSQKARDWLSAVLQP